MSKYCLLVPACSPQDNKTALLFKSMPETVVVEVKLEVPVYDNAVSDSLILSVVIPEGNVEYGLKDLSVVLESLLLCL